MLGSGGRTRPRHVGRWRPNAAAPCRAVAAERGRAMSGGGGRTRPRHVGRWRPNAAAPCRAVAAESCRAVAAAEPMVAEKGIPACRAPVARLSPACRPPVARLSPAWLIHLFLGHHTNHVGRWRPNAAALCRVVAAERGRVMSGGGGPCRVALMGHGSFETHIL